MPRGGALNLHCPITSVSEDNDWAKVPNYSDRIAVGCVVQRRHTSLYGIHGTCDLAIVNASRHHAGKYVCLNVGDDQHEVSSNELSVAVLGNNF